MKPIQYKPAITAWAEDDRPREKFRSKGRYALSDAELIAILLGSGSVSASAVDLAKEILQAYGNKLNNLGRLSIDDLTEFKGIGEAKSITILAALELGRRRRAEAAEEKPKISSSKDVYRLMVTHFGDIDHEEFWVLLLDRAHKLKDKINISRGGISGTVVDQRLIFKPAIARLASAIVLCHNHPSGTLYPSHEDKHLTKKLVQAGTILDIPIIDHLIFTDEGYYSFADEGTL